VKDMVSGPLTAQTDICDIPDISKISVKG
jgi:hypothetical protein